MLNFSHQQFSRSLMVSDYKIIVATNVVLKYFCMTSVVKYLHGSGMAPSSLLRFQ